MRSIAILIVFVLVFGIITMPFIELFSMFVDKSAVSGTVHSCGLAAITIAEDNYQAAYAKDSSVMVGNYLGGDINTTQQGQYETKGFTEEFLDNFKLSLNLDDQLQSKDGKYINFTVASRKIHDDTVEVVVTMLYRFKTPLLNNLFASGSIRRPVMTITQTFTVSSTV